MGGKKLELSKCKGHAWKEYATPTLSVTNKTTPESALLRIYAGPDELGCSAACL